MATEAVEKKAKTVKKATKAQPVVYIAVGRRKCAVARVRLMPGEGNFRINGSKTLEEHFGRRAYQITVNQPFVVTGTEGKYDIVALLDGGGLTGQAGALRHGIARALTEVDPELRGILKKAGFLTRDPRMTERKKYGLKKARKRPQFSKR